MIPSLLADTAQRPLRLLAVVELGSNWGHLLRLLPVVRVLRRRGHQVRLVVPDVVAAKTLYGDEDIDIVACPAAPRAKPPAGPRKPMQDYAELLERHAFSDEALIATLPQWEHLLKTWRPDALLTDFAPRALLVARLHRLPLVQMAIGWEAPPAGAALPGIRPGKPVDPAAVQAVEAKLLERLNRRCMAHGAPPLSKVSDLYATGTQLLATWPEADHFGPREVGNYIGPVYSADHGQAVQWAPSPSHRRVRRVLVYLSPDPRNLRIIQALRHLSVQVIAVLPSANKSWAARMALSGWSIGDQPLQLGPLLRSADLVISNASHGLTLASLQMGVPLLVLPRTGEHAMATARLVSTGAVRSLIDAGDVRGHAALIEQMLEGTTACAAAQALASKYAGSTPFRTVLGVVSSLERAAVSRAHAC